MAVSPTPANDHKDKRLTLEEVPEASEPDEEGGERETCEVEGPTVWNDGRQVDCGARDTEVAMEAQVSEMAPDLGAGYEADINRIEVEVHQFFLEPQPCVRYDGALELEILNECSHDVESCIFEAAQPNAKCVAFEATAKYQLDVSADAEAKRKTHPTCARAICGPIFLTPANLTGLFLFRAGSVFLYHLLRFRNLPIILRPLISGFTHF